MRVKLISVLSLVAAPLAAEGWDCKMTVECFDTEACAQSDYDLWVGPVEGSETGYLMSDISGERPMRLVGAHEEAGPQDRHFVSLVQHEAVSLLSVFESGGALYSYHTQDYMVTYRGTCQEGGS